MLVDINLTNSGFEEVGDMKCELLSESNLALLLDFTELVRFVSTHSKSLGCRKMFLMTNTGNVSACRCYEKAGGISAAADVVMYEYKK